LAPLDALRARINNQIALRLPSIAAASAVKLWRRRLMIRQMDFPLDLCLGASDLLHLRDRTCSILGVCVDAKTRALSFDPLPLILVLAWLCRRVIRFRQCGWNPWRFRADKKVIWAVAHPCNPNGWMNTIVDRH
jgi:hypothetical protein